MTKSTLNFEHLADWVDNRLSEEEAGMIAKQMESVDEATQESVAWLKAFTRAGKTTKLSSPPPELRSELIRRFKEYSRERKQPGFFQRLIASLTFDSDLQMVAAGARSVESPASQRQLIYSTDLADIALNIQPRSYNRDFNITGEVFSNGDSTAGPLSVQLLQENTELKLTMVDEMGEFVFESVPPGVYTVILSATEAEILIMPVEINL